MHHKRHRPKHQRSGCLWCKPHKDERAPKEPRAKRELAVLAEPLPVVVETQLDAAADVEALNYEYGEDW